MKNRSLIWMAVWSILTLGIYTVAWMFMTRRELMRVGSRSIPSIMVWISPVLVMIVLGTLYMMIRGLMATGDAASFTAWDTAAIVLLYFLGLSATVGLFIWWTWRYAEAAAAVLKGSKSVDFVFWMGVGMYILGVPFVWTLVMQDDYNKLTNGEA